MRLQLEGGLKETADFVVDAEIGRIGVLEVGFDRVLEL